MQQVVCAAREPVYPKPEGTGRRPVGLERMLRIYFLQQWFNLSDPAVEAALSDSRAMRAFVGLDLGAEPVPDETTVCRFRHLLDAHPLGSTLLETVNAHLRAQGLTVSTGTSVDATILHAPSSTKNAEQARDCTQWRRRWRGQVDRVEQEKNRRKSKVRAKIEHVFGFTKVRYRGLAKNTPRLEITCALANLCLARRRLLPAAT